MSRKLENRIAEPCELSETQTGLAAVMSLGTAVPSAILGVGIGAEIGEHFSNYLDRIFDLSYRLEASVEAATAAVGFLGGAGVGFVGAALTVSGLCVLYNKYVK